MVERNERLAAVRARLERVAATRALSPVLEPAAEVERRRLAEAIGDAPDPGARFLLGWLHWYRYQALPRGEDRQDFEAAVTLFTEAFVTGAGADDVPPPLLPIVAERAERFAVRRLTAQTVAYDKEQGTAVVALWQRIVHALPADRPGRWSSLANLGAAHRLRFMGTGVLADLDSAVVATEAAVAAMPPDEVARSGTLCNFGVMLLNRYEHSGVVSDLNRAIGMIEAAVAGAEAGTQELETSLVNLGNALRIRYDLDGSDADLSAAISATLRALAIDPSDASGLANLGIMLAARFDRYGEPADIERAVEVLRTAVEATHPDFPNRCGRLSSLGSALRLRHSSTKDVADLDEAVAVLRAAVEAAGTRPVRGMLQNNLAATLHIRAGYPGAPDSLDAAIEAGAAAVAATPEDNPNHAGTLANLGRMFRDRYERTGAVEDLDAAIFVLERSAAAGGGDLTRALTLHNLSHVLHRRAERTGEPADLDAAIETGRAAVAATPAGTPDRAERMSLLSVLLRDRAGATGSDDDLDQAVALARAAVDIAVPDDATRAAHLSNLAAFLELRFQNKGDGADIDDAVRAIRAAVSLAPADDPNRPLYQSNLTSAHQKQFEHSGATEDLEAAVASITAVLRDTPRDSPNRTLFVRNLAAVLRNKYERSRSPHDLDTAITTIEAAGDLGPADLTLSPEDGWDGVVARVVELLGDEHAVHVRYALAWLHFHRSELVAEDRRWPEQEAAMSLFRLCFLTSELSMPDPLRTAAAQTSGLVVAMVQERAASAADLPVIEALPTVWRRIADALPSDDATRARAMVMLSTAQWARFQHGGSPEFLDAAIDTLRGLVDTAPFDEPEHSDVLTMLGSFLGARYQRVGRVEDLTPAVDAIRAAVEATEDPSRRARHLDGLAAALSNRFTGTGSSADLDEAISAGREALGRDPDGAADRHHRLEALATLFRLRFEKYGNPADVHEAIELARSAVDSCPDGPELASCLDELATSLTDRFEITGRLADLDAAVEHQRAAVPLAVDATVRADCLSGLCTSLRLRFRRTGASADLNEAIEAGRAALDATPSDHRAYGRKLHLLAIALRMRGEETGALSDVDEAVEMERTAVRRTPPGQVDRAGRLSGLGAALLIRHRRTGTEADLDEAIEACELAVEATPPGQLNHGRYLSNLALALWTRYERTGEPADLTAAVRGFETSVAAAPAGAPDRARHAGNLSEALHGRFERTGDPADLDAAVDNLRIAVDSAPADDPDRAKYLYSLAGALRQRAVRTGSDTDRAAALTAYEKVTESTVAPPSVRIRAASVWASLIGRSDPARAAAVLEDAVRLLPEVAPRHLRRGDQQYALQGTAGLAADAAALALTAAAGSDSARAEHALRLLEAGRAVLLNQALDTRSDHTDLRERHPELAARFERLRDSLDRPLDDRPSAPQQRHRQADEFAATLAEIRAQEGFAAFAFPPGVDELLAETVHGPVVAFNVSRYRSDALLLTGEGVRAVGLPDLGHDALAAQVEVFYRALRDSTDPDVGSAERRDAQGRISGVLGWLWDSALEPVLEALGHTDTPASPDAWPRVWWMPGGLLGLLPLHAAGRHGAVTPDGRRPAVFDRVISSYTPTVQALRHARRRPPAPPGPPRALIVAMPTTPRVPGRLPHVPAEAEMLRRHLFHPVVLEEPDPGAAPSGPLPTKANVLARLPGCPIAHFACHGASDPVDPSRSRLLLHDHDSDPLTVAGLAPVRLDEVQLAFLSACRTAVADTTDLADEAIHLASAFQLAGYPHVIGTLWEIDDMISVEVAERFYLALHAGRKVPDVSEAAAALHRAVRAVRDRYPALPSLWAAHLHAGA
ncbi:CHAT domain-containing protein [Streptomyces sp. AS58]|uniref:CHAT domain-containing protein n=1 Tax=Streptomyces sp. AS58 TaxID=1519489 RepID=UPI0006AFF81A|nr:CHAT domain-containing protein [Streptomyces sp. AS58]